MPPMPRVYSRFRKLGKFAGNFRATRVVMASKMAKLRTAGTSQCGRSDRERERERERERFNSDRTRDVPRERQRADADRKCESTGIGDLFPETASLDSPLRFGLRVRTHARATAVGRPLRGRSATPLERRARNYSREHRSTRVELYIKYIHKIHTIRISRGTHAGFTLISEHIRAI